MIGPFPATEFLELHRRLALTIAPSNGEEPRRRLLADLLDSHGIAHHSDNAGNLIASVGNGPWQDSVVLDAHLDVVERGGALEVRNDGECLRGLGVADDLAAVTVLALALVRLAQGGESFARQLVFLFSTGEEGLGNLRGVRQFVADRRHAPFAFISFDGTRETFSLTALGSQRYQIEAQTPGGHSWAGFGQPNAIEIVLDFLAKIREDWRVATANAGEQPSSYNFGTIQGGQGINSIARHARATFEFRSVAQGILQQLDADARRAVEQLQTNCPGSDLRLQLLGERPAGTACHRDRLLPLVDAVLGQNAGSPPREVPMSTNINVPLAHEWPAVCLGLCQSGNAHREDEYVRLDSLPSGWHGLNHLLQFLLSEELTSRCVDD